jgi:hypothetical protein
MMKRTHERPPVKHGRVASLRHSVIWLKHLAPPDSEARWNRAVEKILHGVAEGTFNNYLSEAKRGTDTPSWQEIVAASQWALDEGLPDLILERYGKEVDEEMAPLRSAFVESPELFKRNLKMVLKLMLIRKELGPEKFLKLAKLIVPDIIVATLGTS